MQTARRFETTPKLVHPLEVRIKRVFYLHNAHPCESRTQLLVQDILRAQEDGRARRFRFV